MKKLLCTTSVLCLLAAPCAAQTSTATGVGIANSESTSAAGAVAVNRGNGNSRSNSSLTINNPAVTTATVNSNQTISGGTTNRTEVTGTSTVKNVPTAVAPSLAAAGIETCLGSVSGGGSFVGTGLSFGGTVPDPGCQARLDARTLWSMGLKSAAVVRLCIREDIYRSMPDICEQYRTPNIARGYGFVTYVEADPLLMAAPRRGAIQVVNGKTGLTAMCDNYDEARQKCLKWQGETKVASAKPRVAKPRTASGRPIVMTSAVQPTAKVPVTSDATTGPVDTSKPVTPVAPGVLATVDKK